jgi:tRNA threonylcarbamoyladenosine biosynthesis protein TsaE
MDPRRLPSPAEFTRCRTVIGESGTRALGAELAAVLSPGDAVLLHGSLGAGKTCLVQGLCAALGHGDEVVSPTFTLVNHYPGRRGVHHLDLYRIEPEHDLDDLGLEDVLDQLDDGRTLLVAEWPRLLEPLLPRRVELLATVGDEPEVRLWHARGVPALPEPVAALFPEEVAPC